MTELKALNNPPAAVKMVMDAVLILLGQEDLSWNNAKKMLANPEHFINMFV